MPLASAPDAGLVARCRAGDQRAWQELVQRFSPYVYSILVRAYGLREEDARDVFQEVFARTWERLDSVRDDAAIKPWIAQVARNLARDHLRRARPRDEQPLEAFDPPGANAQLETLDEALAVRAELAQLPTDCRDILERFFMRDESYGVIAAARAMTVGAVAGRKSRCLELLRGRLERTEAPPVTSRGM